MLVFNKCFYFLSDKGKHVIKNQLDGEKTELELTAMYEKFIPFQHRLYYVRQSYPSPRNYCNFNILTGKVKASSRPAIMAITLETYGMSANCHARTAEQNRTEQQQEQKSYEHVSYMWKL